MLSRALSFVLRWGGFFVLCVAVGVALEKAGLPAHGTLHDVWQTFTHSFRYVDRWFVWAMPYAVLGGLVVGPLVLMALFDRFRRRGR